MRSRLVALLCILLLAPLWGQAAFASDRELAGPSLPEQASETAREHAEAALARAEALFEERSPAAARRRLAAHGRDATMVLNEVVRTRGELAPADRVRADALLARPIPDGDNIDGAIVKYDNGEETPVCQGIICVHYARGPDSDAPPNGDTGPVNGIPDQVDQALETALRVNTTYDEAGYRHPDPDGGLGGSDQVDIYLADIGDLGLYGYCTTDEDDKPAWNRWAYCVIDDDFARVQFPSNSPLENQQVTLAHEYFHAVQYAYDFAEDPWFMEATATWAEDEVFDGVNDNRQYLPSGQLGRPGVPLDQFGGDSGHYGNWIFFRYLTERWRQRTGSMPRIVLEMVRKISGRAGDRDMYSTQAIRSVLARRDASFTKVYGQFADANRRPGKAYDEGRAYRAASPARTTRLSKGKRRVGDTVRLKHLTSRTLRFKPGRGTRPKSWRLRLKVDMPAERTAPVARVSAYLKSGKVRSTSVRLNRRTKGSKVVPFSSRKVRYVELVLANASLRSRCWSDFKDPVFACFGKPKDNGAKTDFSASIFRR